MKYTCQVHVSLVNFLTDPNETLNEEVFILSLWICFTYLAGENNPQFQAESCTAQIDYKIDSTFKLMVTIYIYMYICMYVCIRRFGMGKGTKYMGIFWVI